MAISPVSPIFTGSVLNTCTICIKKIPEFGICRFSMNSTFSGSPKYQGRNRLTGEYLVIVELYRRIYTPSLRMY
jgi:hypothetical protein